MPHRIVIVGGVAAGASAATRARRLNEDADIVIYEQSGHVSFANCGLPYYIGNVIKDRDKLLLMTPELFKRRFNIEVHVRHEVTAVDRPNRRIRVRNLEDSSQTWRDYDRLILATGAGPLIPGIEGTKAPNVFVLRNIEDMDRIHAYVARQDVRHVAVVGAGFIGLEASEVLTQRRLCVDLIEMTDQVLPQMDADMAKLIENELREHGVAVHVGQAVQRIEHQDGKDSCAILAGGTRIATDMILLGIGVRPNARLAAEAGLELGANGHIRVNEYQQTSDPNIFAAGDVAEVVQCVTNQHVAIPLAGAASKHGRLAGEMAATGSAPPAARVAGTTIVSAFDKTAAMTGLSLKAARQLEWPAEFVRVRRPQHVGYYPGAQPMDLKLIYEKSTRRILGAQIVGGSGVDRRIDVVATCLHFGGTIEDLTKLDLAYAPQFGAARDPIHIAGYVAENQQGGLIRHVDEDELEQLRSAGCQLVDVRHASEVRRGTLRNARHIDVDHLRERLSEIDPDLPVVLWCASGYRSYIAARILMNHGRSEVYSLAGGYDGLQARRATRPQA